jgi:hypothetical protein
MVHLEIFTQVKYEALLVLRDLTKRGPSLVCLILAEGHRIEASHRVIR